MTLLSKLKQHEAEKQYNKLLLKAFLPLALERVSEKYVSRVERKMDQRQGS